MAVAAVLLGAFDETRYRLAVPKLWRLAQLAILLLGLVSLIQLRNDNRQLKGTSSIDSASDATEANRRIRENLLAIQGRSLLSPYAEMLILSLAEVNADHLKQKIALGENVMHFDPIAQAVYRQTYFLAQDGQLEQAKRLLEQAVWSYPDNREAHQLLQNLAEKDPAHFSALLEFALQKEQEHNRAVHHQ